MHTWWKVAKAYPESLQVCRLMVKFLAGEEPLAWNTGRYIKPRSMQNRICKICNAGAFETVSHFLFECPALASQRSQFINTLCELCAVGENIVTQGDFKSIISASLFVGANYKYRLKCIGSRILDMYYYHQFLMKTVQ